MTDFIERIILFMCNKNIFITSGSRGGATGARPPNGRGPMIFLCPKRKFSSFLCCIIICCIHLVEIWPKHAKNDWTIDFKIKMHVVGCRIIIIVTDFIDRIILFMCNQNIIIYSNIIYLIQIPTKM